MSEPRPSIGPAAERVRRQLLDQVQHGLLRPGERLGAERDLATKLGVSRSTVRQALAALESAGAIRRVPGEAEEHIEVVAAGEGEASILGTEPGAPLLSITRTTKDGDGVVFEYSHDLFRADRTVISVRTPAAPRSTRGAGRVVA